LEVVTKIRRGQGQEQQLGLGKQPIVNGVIM
jgi:hypothetical protein